MQHKSIVVVLAAGVVLILAVGVVMVVSDSCDFWEFNLDLFMTSAVAKPSLLNGNHCDRQNLLTRRFYFFEAKGLFVRMFHL